MKSGLPNAIFVVAAAEHVPHELSGIADALTIHFPWASLLRGVLALDGGAARGIADLLKPGTRAIATFSIEARDGLDLPALDDATARRELVERWSCLGVDVCGFRVLSTEDLRSIQSTWARRLAAGRDRAASQLDLERRQTQRTGRGRCPRPV